MSKSPAERYVASIRNSAKQSYAVSYLAFLNGLRAEEPEHPGLSYMAAQAVRMNLSELLGGRS